MTYVKTYLSTLKTHVVNLKRDAKDLSRDLQRLEVRGKLGSKTLYYLSSSTRPLLLKQPHVSRHRPINLLSKQMYHRIDAILLASSEYVTLIHLAGKPEFAGSLVRGTSLSKGG